MIFFMSVFFVYFFAGMSPPPSSAAEGKATQSTGENELPQTGSSTEPSIGSLLTLLAQYTEDGGLSMSAERRKELSAHIATLATELEERLEARFAEAEMEADLALEQLAAVQAEVRTCAHAV